MAFNLERWQRGKIITFFKNYKELLQRERNELLVVYCVCRKEVSELKLHQKILL